MYSSEFHSIATHCNTIYSNKTFNRIYILIGMANLLWDMANTNILTAKSRKEMIHVLSIDIEHIKVK